MPSKITVAVFMRIDRQDEAQIGEMEVDDAAPR